jgi:methionine-rich copper-binding protein CopC
MFAQKDRLLRALSAAVLLAALSFTIAAAHQVEPLTASPAPGEVLGQAPSEVRLTFSEELSEDGSMLQVFDASGKQVDAGKGGVDLDDPQHATLVVGMPRLGEGIYLVKWKVTLSDGDASQGEYQFGIGNVTLAASSAPAAAEEPPASSGPNFAVWSTVAIVGILVVVAGVYFVNKSRTAA